MSRGRLSKGFETVRYRHTEAILLGAAARQLVGEALGVHMKVSACVTEGRHLAMVHTRPSRNSDQVAIVCPSTLRDPE